MGEQSERGGVQNKRLQQINIEDYFDLVRFICKQFYGDQDDLFQIGCIALLKAKEKYNPELGQFSTLAYKCIRNDISKYIRKEIKYSKNLKNISGDIQEIAEDNFTNYMPDLSKNEKTMILMRKDGYTIKEIADKLNLNPVQAEVLNQKTKKKIADANKNTIS